MTIQETERLIIREFTMEDFDDLNAMNSDPEVTKYILGRPFSAEESMNYLKSYLEFYKKKTGLGVFAAIEKETGSFLGWVCLRPFHTDDEIELGYRLNQKSWGKGYATELAKTMVAYGFKKLNLKEIIAIVVPANKNSKNVLSKAGLKYLRNMDYKSVDGDMNVEFWITTK
jgi:ribosomal-protein-alanine N-acetyltransferase